MTKLDGIEASATADQTASEIKTAYESNSNTNAFTDALQTKLNGIEASATADQSDAEIKTAYENNSDTNAFTDALLSKLNGIEASATADQSASEIKTAYESNSDTNAFTDALLSKLNGIAAGATNVTNTNQLTNGAGFVTTDTNTTYSAGNGLTLSGTQFRLGGNSTKQLIVNSPNTGVVSKSGGWTEVHSSLRTSITCTSSSSKLIISFTFVYGGNNNSQIGAFKIRDITGNFDVNMSSYQNRAASHGTTRHRDHDVNDVEMITVTALVEAGQTSTSSRTYSLYHKNEGNGGVTKYFRLGAKPITRFLCQARLHDHGGSNDYYIGQTP